MEGSTGWIDVTTLAKEAHVLQLGSVEVSGDGNLFSSDDDDLLSLEEFFGHNRGQTTKKVVLSVNDDCSVRQTHRLPCKIL
ncbi:hypothetical protein GCK72_009695 [Caenorhabditis remanei]|uniref:Uncharacterized protein n=1 Tax=Caenorhabditis remanei TaxID=31234 RepID=A0A6A5H387_CAERE|nr:hypothetical protein GCK72_009695 [Caenorhabditis remanei]KAF1761439.1 hypothetical protein GCK72_009695 [Caenorhabditis remanei]